MNGFKNTITNLLGLVFWGFAVKELTSDESDIYYISSLVIIGIILFRYKFSETKKVIDSFLNKVPNTSRTVDPDRDYPDDERG